MINDTQIGWVKDQIELNGKISRNLCLRNYTTRLGAIINTLNKDGWNLKGEYIKTEYGLDYVYSKKKTQESTIPQEETRNTPVMIAEALSETPKQTQMFKTNRIY